MMPSLPPCSVVMLTALALGPRPEPDPTPPADEPLPAAVARFLGGDAEVDFGEPHPAAPPETEQFGRLVGVWRCTQHAFAQGQWLSGWEAVWAFKYALDGFAVQDLWLTPEANLPPTKAGLGHDFVGTNLRIYDPVSKRWEIVWAHNGADPATGQAAMRHLTAVAVGDELVQTPDPTGDGPLRRVIWHDVSRDEFHWRSETSTDGGKTWTPQLEIVGTRLR